jgi:hypothetical protein
MNTSDILGVLGIVATIVLGVWGIIIAVRRRYPGQLTYIKEPYIELFDSIVKNLPELSILYNNAPVGQGLVLIKGAILNTGSKDITNEMVEQELTFALPEGFRWLTAKVTGNSGNVAGTADIQDRSLVFTTGLFRCNEFIRFQAIAEVPVHNANDGKQSKGIEERLDEAISITHRIADTQKVTAFNYRKQGVTFMLALQIVMMIIMVFLLGPMFFKDVPTQWHYFVNDTNGIPHEVVILKEIDRVLMLQGVNDDFRKSITRNEFSMQPLKATVSIRSSSQEQMLYRITSLFLVAPLLMMLFAFREHRKAKMLRRLLGIL